MASNSDAISNDNSKRTGQKEAEAEGALSLSNANKRINSLLRSIRSLLKSTIQKPDKDKLNSKIERLTQISHSHGLTSKQASQVLRLASGLDSNLTSNQEDQGDSDGEPKIKINTSTSIKLTKLILPRPGEKFNRDFVLLILGNLSSPPGVLEDAPGGQDHLREGLKARKKLDLKVQAACLRHLLLLLSPPSANNLSLLVSSPIADDPADTTTTSRRPDFSSISNDETVQAGPKAIPVPSTFLSPQAKRLLSKCYGVLFHFLEYSTLRPYLCQLLCHLTTRKHVKQYRITRLLEMMKTLSSEPPLSALISVYSNFYPDMLFPELVGGSSSASSILGGGSGNIQGLKYPDLNWLAKVHWLYSFPEGSGPSLIVEASEEGKDPNSTNDAESRPTKKIKLSSSIATSRGSGGGSNLLPSATTLSFSPDSIIISEISSMKHFARSLVRLELPSQLASSLENHLVRLALFLEGDKVGRISNEERISNWLKSKLEDEIGIRVPIFNADKGEDEQENDNQDDSFTHKEDHGINSSRSLDSFTLPQKSASGIKRIDQLFRRSSLSFHHEGRLSNGLQNWLYGILKLWDGKSYVDGICSLVALVDVRSWKELSNHLLSPLRRIAVSSETSVHTRSRIIHSIAHMLSRWANVSWREAREEFGSNSSLSKEEEEEAMDKVADWASELAHLLIRIVPESIHLQDATLSLFEVLSTAPTSPDLQSSTRGIYSDSLPSLPLLYVLCFARPGNLMILSRLCGILYSVRITFQQHDQFLNESDYFQKFERLPDSTKKKLETCFSEEKRKGLNEIVSSVANLVWTTKAFNALEEGSIDIGLDGQLFKDLSNRCDERGDVLSSIAAITSGLSFAALAEDAFNIRAQKDGLSKSFSAPIGKGSLTEAKKFGLSLPYTELRAYLLSYVAERGAKGLNDLLCASMSSLSKVAANA